MRDLLRIGVLAMGLALTTSVAQAAGLFAPWNDGTGANEPDMQVQTFDDDTYVIRQSIHTSVGAPFLYLLFGKERALLLDTGDRGESGLKIRPTIDGIIESWLKAHGRKSMPLVVAHTHSHSDHHAGDGEFSDRPQTTLVGLRPGDVAAYFGIAHWPDDIAQLDLGGRVLDIIPAPGHEPAHIVIYDRNTKLLLSGDVLLPGHVLYPFGEAATLRKSVDRVAGFMAKHEVSWILGTHIEMTKEPGKDYKFDAPSHPNEHVLELPASAMTELQAGLKTLGDSHEAQVHDDFIILPLPPEVLAPYAYRG